MKTQDSKNTTAKKVTSLKNAKGITKVASKGDAKTIIESSKKSLSDADLLALASSVNADFLTEKAINKSNFWKVSKDANKAKAERTKLRRQQLELSKKVLSNMIVSKASAKEASQNLKDFYSKNLISMNVYTNVSRDKNADKYDTLHNAYKIMQTLLK